MPDPEATEKRTQTTSNNLTAFNMDEHESGMEMMLSSMVAPLDDDLPWQFDDQIIKENDTLDSAAQSPSSSLFSDFDDSCTSSFSSSLSSPSFTTSTETGTSSLSSFDMMMSMFPDPTNPTVSEERMVAPPVPVRKNVVVRRRPRECSMVCWLFRTLLTSEYRALPVNAIFEIFEETMQQTTAGSGRHYRQSIRHCLMTSAVFVRVLTPNPRKDFLVMNEQGSWWTVHPDCEVACAEHVFKSGSAHRCPPQASIPAYYARVRMEEAKAAANAGNSSTGPIRTQFGYSSAPSSECSSTSSSSASSPAPSVNVRRFDPIRKVSYGPMNTGPRVTYKTVSAGFPQKTMNGFVPQPTLLNPRSILLNDIAVDHEEVV